MGTLKESVTQSFLKFHIRSDERENKRHLYKTRMFVYIFHRNPPLFFCPQQHETRLQVFLFFTIIIIII
jgi:hypothetical protein